MKEITMFQVNAKGYSTVFYYSRKNAMHLCNYLSEIGIKHTIQKTERIKAYYKGAVHAITE